MAEEIVTRKNLVADGAHLARSFASWSGDTGAGIGSFRYDAVHGWVMRITCTDGAIRLIYQTGIVPIGTDHTVRTWFRGDGILQPRILTFSAPAGNIINEIGTASTAWQRVDVEGAGQASALGLYLRTNGVEAAGRWVEFAEVELIESTESIIVGGAGESIIM